jgi:hypothetical protein
LNPERNKKAKKLRGRERGDKSIKSKQQEKTGASTIIDS